VQVEFCASWLRWSCESQGFSLFCVCTCVAHPALKPLLPSGRCRVRFAWLVLKHRHCDATTPGPQPHGGSFPVCRKAGVTLLYNRRGMMGERLLRHQHRSLRATKKLLIQLQKTDTTTKAPGAELVWVLAVMASSTSASSSFYARILPVLPLICRRNCLVSTSCSVMTACHVLHTLGRIFREAQTSGMKLALQVDSCPCRPVVHPARGFRGDLWEISQSE
jgi:hypothetical protein